PLEKVKGIGADEDLDPENLPLWGTPKRSGFRVAGPLLRANEVVLFPAPANWFCTQGEDEKRLYVKEARPEDGPYGVKVERQRCLWIYKPGEEMKPLNGLWVTSEALNNENEFELEIVEQLGDLTADKPQAVPSKLLFAQEERVGIARELPSRTARRGHLYSTRHIRLAEGISLLLRLDKLLCPSHLAPEGIFQLGGEGRMVRYCLFNVPPPLPVGKGRWLAISPVEQERLERAGLLSVPYAAGKPMRIAGWDLREAFHKPVKAYFPAGAVFFSKKDPDLCELIPF
ncbi:MAG: hypothetical protein DRG83_18555, partial [Deltaproteobacteria bacterium]